MKEQNDNGKPRAEVQPSMHRRMNEWDYSQPRIYMITLATEGRRPLLGLLRGNPAAAPGSIDAPRVVLSELGRWVNGEVEHIPDYYPQIRVLAKQVMPDHLHMLLHVTAPLPCHLGKVISGFKAGCNRGYRTLFPAQQSCTAPNTPPGQAAPNTPQAGGRAAAGGTQPAQQSCTAPNTPTGQAAPGTQAAPGRVAAGGMVAAGGTQAAGGTAGAATQRVGCPAAVPQERGASPRRGLLWEPGYHDRLLSGEGQLQTLIDYIHDNPRRLLVKRSHSGLFRVRTIAIGNHALQAVGNLALLRGSRRIAVRLSRRLTPADIAAEVERLLAEARAGAVLVSPFISPGERAVRDAALAAALPMIRLLENGFPPLYKPFGAAFEACANGRLLLLSPWPYHTQRTAITRDQCHILNVLAAEIAAM